MKFNSYTILLTFFGLTIASADISLWSRDTTHQLTKRCPPFDPAGVKNIGNGAAGQFIGGQCLSNTDCASNCCATPCGICSGPGASTQAGKTGCGFSSGGVNNGQKSNANPPTSGTSQPLQPGTGNGGNIPSSSCNSSS